MTRVKPRLTAALCALAVVCALILPLQRVSAATVYLLAVNDKMCDPLPIVVDGTVYVPYTAFDKNVTEVDLGVYYGLDQGSVLTLYALSGRLVFSVSAGTCTDNQGNQMSYHAVSRGGTIYVPASAVCGYFGLSYSFLPTSDRGTLIRICNSSANYTDSVFLSSVSRAMSQRYNSIVQAQDPQPSPSPSSPAVTPAPTAAPTAQPGVSGKEDVTVYLAMDASQAGEELLSLFGSERVLLLFTPDSLPAQSGLVRRAVAAGHSVGLMVDGDLETALAQLEEGNRLLTHIARIRTRLVSAPEGLTAQLSQAGWRCWQNNISPSDSAAALLRALESKRSVARLLLPADAYVIGRVLSSLRADGYTLRQPLETEL